MTEKILDTLFTGYHNRKIYRKKDTSGTLCYGWSAAETVFFLGPVCRVSTCRGRAVASLYHSSSPMQPSPAATMQLQLLLVAVCPTLLVAAKLPPAHGVELKALAGFVRRAGEHANNDRDRHRLSLRHLKSMWHTSLGKEVGRMSCGADEVDKDHESHLVELGLWKDLLAFLFRVFHI